MIHHIVEGLEVSTAILNDAKVQFNKEFLLFQIQSHDHKRVRAGVVQCLPLRTGGGWNLPPEDDRNRQDWSHSQGCLTGGPWRRTLRSAGI